MSHTIGSIGLDSLSVIFSYLGQCDFIHARLSSNEWYSASKLASASPTLDIDRIIHQHQQVIIPNFTAHYRDLSYVMGRWPSIQIAYDLPIQSFPSPNHADHRFIRAITLYIRSRSTESGRHEEQPNSSRLAQVFPNLQAIAIGRVSPYDRSDFKFPLDRLVGLFPNPSRLQILMAYDLDLPSDIGIFIGLRLLICRTIPAVAIERLIHLVHLEVGQVKHNILNILQLSQDHSLRGLVVHDLELGSLWYDIGPLTPVANLTSLDLIGTIPNSIPFLFTLPSLTSTSVRWSSFENRMNAIHQDIGGNVKWPWPKIRSMRIDFHNTCESSILTEPCAELLALCTTLTNLQVEFPGHNETLAKEIATSFSRLERLVLRHYDWDGITLQMIRQLTSRCKNLRQLDSGFTSSDNWCDESVSLFSQLSQFERWTFEWHPEDWIDDEEDRGYPSPLEFTTRMLRSIGSSQTWHSIEVLFDMEGQSKDWYRISTNNIWTKDLNYRALNQFRLYWISQDLTYRISEPDHASGDRRQWIDQNGNPRRFVHTESKKCRCTLQ